MVHKFSLVIDIFHLFSPMANPKDMFEGIDNLPFNLCETDDFLEDSIDPDNNMSNDSKFSKIRHPLLHPWWSNYLFKRMSQEYVFYFSPKYQKCKWKFYKFDKTSLRTKTRL